MDRISTNQLQQRAINALLDQQSKVSDVQQQIATGRRILNPSDDPSGSARALELAQSIEGTNRNNRNIGLAESRLNIEESVLKEVGNTLTRVRELAVKAKNDSNSAADRNSIATEVRTRLDELLQLANSTDGNGEYLFAGAQTDSRAFTKEDGVVTYRGDQTERRVQVGPGRTIATNHTGFDAFVDLGASYAAEANTANPSDTALAVYRSASSAADVDGYTVAFSTNPTSGGLQYTVSDAGGSTVKTASYDANQPIELADQGVTFSVNGAPQAGDGFQVSASAPEERSTFAIVDRFADALEVSPSTSGNAFQASGDRALAELDNALEGLLQVRAEIGGRLNGLDSERSANDAAALELKSTRSDIRDLDYASAISELSRRLAGMQAAQKSYSKIQGMSLFDYL